MGRCRGFALSRPAIVGERRLSRVEFVSQLRYKPRRRDRRLVGWRRMASKIQKGAMMAAQTSMLHIRVDDQLKAAATEKLANLGLTVSDAVRILLTRVAKDGALPAGLAADP